MIAYRYDGSLEGIFCALFRSFLLKEEPIYLTSTSQQTDLFITEIEIKTDQKIAERVRKGIIKNCGIGLLSNVFYILRSSDENKATHIFNLLKKSLIKKQDLSNNFSDSDAVALYELKNKISNERHRICGFLRFQETSGGGFYAHFEPDNDILDLILPHFCERYKNERLMIHDTKRNLLALYYQGKKSIVSPTAPIVVILSPNEKEFNLLWKTYYNSVTIASRKNTKLMNNYLPRRYRKNMTEFFADDFN